jgi:hypothetical protein
MRPPGGPPTRGTVLPTSTAVEENGGKQGLVEVRSSLRELTVLLEPQSDHEASARREEPPDETADEAIAQANLGLLYAERAEGGWVAQRGVFIATLVAFFIAEIGDKTQVATIALASKRDSKSRSRRVRDGHGEGARSQSPSRERTRA